MDSSPLTSMIFPYFPSQTTMASGISPMDSIWILHDSTIKIHRSIDPPSSGRSPDSWYEGRWHWPKCSSSSPGRWPGSYWEMIWEKGSNLDDFLGVKMAFSGGRSRSWNPQSWPNHTSFLDLLLMSFCDLFSAADAKIIQFVVWQTPLLWILNDADEWSRQHP